MTLNQKTKVIVVHVTQEDIDRGCKSAPFSCPIARALRRMYPDASIGVTEYAIYIGDGLTAPASIYDLPQEAGAFIRAFDSSEKVEPFTFTVIDSE